MKAVQSQRGCLFLFKSLLKQTQESAGPSVSVHAETRAGKAESRCRYRGRLEAAPSRGKAAERGRRWLHGAADCGPARGTARQPGRGPAPPRHSQWEPRGRGGQPAERPPRPAAQARRRRGPGSQLRTELPAPLPLSVKTAVSSPAPRHP